MALKCSFKLFFLKCVFEFMINTAPQGSNSVNGRVKYFKAINFKDLKLCSGHMAHWYEVSLFALEEVGVQVQIPMGLPAIFFRFFFSFIVFLPFGLFTFILIADPL